MNWTRLRQKAIFERKTDGALGYDLVACIEEPLVIIRGEVARVPLGVAVAAPNGALLMIRSGTAGRGLSLANGVGLIDADYRGELTALLRCEGPRFLLMPGDRICQLVPMPPGGAEPLTAVQVEQLDETPRGAAGFGSTGHD
jgi:dUTP pyrophosphatase